MHTKEYEVSNPLLMQVLPKKHGNGLIESLNLSRWVQPYTDEFLFKIKSDNVLIMADASPGLCKYYEYVLEKLSEIETHEVHNVVTKFQREDVDADDEEIYEEMLANLNTRSDPIH